MIRIFLILLLIPSVCIGANYYVDPTYNGSNGSSNGTFLRPWKTLAQVNSHKFSTGDGLFFKAGTVMVMPGILNISWSGTANSRAIIGAYHGEGQFDNIPENDRPVLDGSEHTVPARGSWSGMIQHLNGPGYVTIQDLEVRNSGGVGINLGQSSAGMDTANINAHYLVRRCTVHRPWRQGVIIARSSNNIVEENYFFETSYGRNKGVERVGGASIEITAMEQPVTTRFNVVKKNTVVRPHEGIGVYKQASHTIIEGNTIYDGRTYHIYCSRSHSNIIKDNVVYGTPEARYEGRGGGIVLLSEIHDYTVEPFVGNHQVFNNYIAGMMWGLHWGVNPGATVGMKGNRIYNNRLVDNMINISTQRSNEDFSDNRIFDNYSFIYTDSYIDHNGNTVIPRHVNVTSPIGTTWSGNFFTTPPIVTGNATTGSFLNKVQLKKTTGWRNLKPGKVDRSFFAFTGESLDLDNPKSDELTQKPGRVSNFKMEASSSN